MNRLSRARLLQTAACAITLALATRAGAGPAQSPRLAPGKVDIVRDSWGVAHIFAAREEDGYYGLGYAMGQDQLTRFFLRVLAMRGELAQSVKPSDLTGDFAELGATVDALVASDYRARLWALKERSQAFTAKLDPQVRRNYASFLRGLEAYAGAHPEKVPAWRPKNIDIADLVALPQSELWPAYQGGIGVGDCARAGVEFKTPEKPLAAEKRGFSNEWALMPTRTSTGGAVLLSDPHGGMDGRFTYEARIRAGGFEYTGFLQGGLPIVGRNPHVAWGLTTGAPDVADCYAIALTAPGAVTYLFDGQPRRLLEKTIEIRPIGQGPRQFQVRYADINGVQSPVIAEKDGVVFAVSTPYINRLADFHNIANHMVKAKTVDALRTALSDGGFFPQNILAADTKGDILYAHNGLTPIRPDPKRDWTQPVPGNASDLAWKGLHPAKDMLVIRSPASGYIENNNVDPRRMDNVPPPETIGRPDYIMVEGMTRPMATHNRPARFLEAVASKPIFSEADVWALAFDTGLVGAADWLRLVRQASAAGADAFTADLLTFNGRLEKTSTAALKYVYWREALRGLLVEADLPSLKTAISGGALGPSIAAKLSQSLRQASERLAKAPKGLSRTYGDEFRIASPKGSLAMAGGWTGDFPPGPDHKAIDCQVNELACGATLLPGYYLGPNSDHERMLVAGSRIMQLHFLTPAGIRSYSYQNPGVSDDPDSPHSSDQAASLVSRQALKPVLFDWSELRADARTVVKLSTAR